MKEAILTEANTTDDVMKPCKDCDTQLYSTNICYFRACMGLCIHPDLVMTGEADYAS